MNISPYIINSFYFLFFSILGWLSASIAGSIKNKQWQNRGLLYGPWMPTVGLAAASIQTALLRLPENNWLIFAVGMLFGGLIDYLARWIEEKYLHVQTGKYTGKTAILDGKVDILFLVGYGLFTVATRKFINPLFAGLLSRIPSTKLSILTTWLLGLMLLDFLFSIGTIIQLLEYLKTGQFEITRSKLHDGSSFRQTLNQVGKGEWLSLKQETLTKSYHDLTVITPQGKLDLSQLTESDGQKEIPEEKSFAAGLNYYKLFWIFLIASVMGYIIESVWCIIRHGRLESRQGLIYGPISQVYGIGAVAMTIILFRLLKRGRKWVFLGSALLGGAVEIILSYLQEMCFGSVSWHYGSAGLGIFGGRTSLFYMVFWGFLGLFFIERVYPLLSNLIETIPNFRGLSLTWVIGLLLFCDIGISAVSVYRWSQRSLDIPPSSAIERKLDKLYPDDYMKEVFPNMQFRDNKNEVNSPAKSGNTSH